MNLTDTNLPEPIVKALRKNTITTVNHLFDRTGTEIRNMMPGYYDQINQFICAYERPTHIMKTRSRTGPVQPMPLDDMDVVTIRKLWGKGARTTDLANEFSASEGTIHRIVNFITYKHLS